MVDIHIFPVPHGYTPEQAYDEISVFGYLTDYRWWKPRFWRMRWAYVEIIT